MALKKVKNTFALKMNLKLLNLLVHIMVQIARLNFLIVAIKARKYLITRSI